MAATMRLTVICPLVTAYTRCHKDAVPSRFPAASIMLSGLNAMVLTSRVPPSKVIAASLLISVRHIRTSFPWYVVRWLLSGLNRIDDEPPTRVAANSPVSVRHSRTMWSLPPVASKVPSGLNSASNVLTVEAPEPLVETVGTRVSSPGAARQIWNVLSLPPTTPRALAARRAPSGLNCGCRKRMLPGRMRRGGRRGSARAWRLMAGLHAGGVRWFSACGLEADLPHCHPCRVSAGFVPAGGVVEGRRDLDVAPSTHCRLARAASRSFEIDVAGPGVAGPTRRDAASRPAGRDAADRHSRHDLAMA